MRLAAAYIHVSLPAPATWAESTLVRLLSDAIRNVPFYAELARTTGLSADDIRSLEDVLRFPVTDAAQYREAQQDHGCEHMLDRRLARHCVHRHRSSGSTGEPLELRRTSWEHQVNAAATIQLLRRGGIRPTDRTLAFVTADRMVARDSVLQRLGVYRRTTVPFDMPWNEVIDLVKKKRLNCIYGARSHVELLAEAFEKDPETPDFRTVLVGSEIVTDAHRERIQRGLRPQLLGEWYGSTETGVIAQKVEHDYQVRARTVHARIEEATDPSQPPGIILSSLFMRAQPILNYRIGDRVLAPHVDENGRLSSFESILGRDNDYIVSSEGERVSGTVVFTLIESTHGVRRLRIDQHAPGQIDVSIMLVEEQHAERICRQLGHSLRRLLGDGFQSHVAVVEEIAPLPSGKFAVVRRHFDQAQTQAGEVAAPR